jgi:stage II sporulation protein M
MLATSSSLAFTTQFKRYRSSLMIAIATFGLGAVFGGLAIGTLTMADKAMLLNYVHRFIQVESHAPVGFALFTRTLINNLKLLGLLYILGVSVAGMPLVPVVLFFRGFVAGFAVGFLATSMAWQGIWLSVVTVGLQSLFIVPAILITSAFALNFSWNLVSPKSRDAGPAILEQFAVFTVFVALMGLVMVVGTALESGVAPFLMHLLSNWGI